MSNNQGTAESEKNKPGEAESALASFLNQYQSRHQFPSGKLGEYAFNPSEEIPELSGLATACSVSGMDGDSYGVICHSRYPLRENAIQFMKKNAPPGITRLLASGAIMLPSPYNRSYCMVMEKPRGEPLSALLAVNKSLSGNMIRDQILTPLVKILMPLSIESIAHGRMNAGNIYLGESLTLGECISEPCGYSQPFYYEPPERLLAIPAGKSGSNIAADCYALGILALQLLTGNGDKWKNISRSEFLFEIQQQGAFAYLAGSGDYSDLMYDFLRGTLHENPSERWTLQQIKAWLEGRHITVITSNVTDASRAYKFKNISTNSTRALAQLFNMHWDDAAIEMRDMRLIRWAETNTRRKDAGEKLMRARALAGGEHTRNERMNNELVARSIIVLDPEGPLRSRAVVCEPDAIGGAVAAAYAEEVQENLQSAAEILEMDLLGNWIDNQKNEEPKQKVSSLANKVQRLRNFIRQNGMGLGLERCLYDLNPGLSCQSERLATFAPYNVEEVLLAFDMIATYQTKDSPLLDRHIGAFLASHMKIERHLRIGALAFRPVLMNHIDLITLDLLRSAQESTGNRPLPGLTHWMALRLLSVVSQLYNLPLRDSMEKALVKAARSGSLGDLSFIMLDTDLLQRDWDGYVMASQEYQKLQYTIATGTNKALLRVKSHSLGARMALFVAYTLLAIISYNTF